MRGNDAIRLRMMRVRRLGVFDRIHLLLRLARPAQVLVLIEGNHTDPGHSLTFCRLLIDGRRAPIYIQHSAFSIPSMFIGHIAVGLAGKRATPGVSLAAWLTSVQFVDMLWPIFLLLGLEHVRIAPGITRFTPLDFYDYPVTHSLVGSIAWAALFAGGCLLWYRNARIALLLGA